ncbi:MAG: tRNA lysidine(34) synthetase TilS, partial [Longimicrobiales bacterium]
QLDPAGLTFPLELRGWRPGDQIRLSFGSKKLKKLFVERRVARTRRHQVPVLAESGDGAVLWLAGIARAAVAVPTIGTPTFCVRIEE